MASAVAGALGVERRRRRAQRADAAARCRRCRCSVIITAANTVSRASVEVSGPPETISVTISATSITVTATASTSEPNGSPTRCATTSAWWTAASTAPARNAPATTRTIVPGLLPQVAAVRTAASTGTTVVQRGVLKERSRMAAPPASLLGVVGAAPPSSRSRPGPAREHVLAVAAAQAVRAVVSVGVSSPAPAASRSSPASPNSTSSPPPARIRSLPPRAQMTSSPAVPVRRSSPAVPVIVQPRGCTLNSSTPEHGPHRAARSRRRRTRRAARRRRARCRARP